YILGGTDVSQMADSQLAEVRNKQIGFVFQSFNLLPRYSSLENVALPLIYNGIPEKERIKLATAALEVVGLSDRMDHKPSELSGGQRQRVAIARAIINTPTIILADEPTGNLDTKTSIEIMNIFEKIYRQGNTIIIVTHEEDISKFARRIVRLRDGKVESDTINPAPTLAGTGI
ncbi:MAG: ABC transporter ATP-binding protein, partial [Bacteroidales bacterium]|nr:ABC transporter ATP-binding protein [Bacteroidales bacterium]